MVDALIEVLDLHPNRGESAECPFWGQQRIDVLDVTILRAIAILPELRSLPPAAFAQVVDVAWYRRACDHQLVREAIEAYVGASEASFDPSHWVTSYEYLHRAVCLSAGVRQGTQEHVDLLDRLAQFVLKHGETDPLYFSAKVMGLLIDQRFREGQALAALAGRIADTAANASDFDRAKTYVETQIEWHQLHKDKDAQRAGKRRIAELLEAHATERLANDGALVASHFQAEAVAAWRHAGDRQRAESAHARLQELQRDSVKGFKTYGGEVDLSDSAAQARERVAGKTKPEAVLLTAMLSRPLPVTRLMEQARRRTSEFLFYSLIPRRSVNALGRTTHISNTAVAQTPEDREAALRDEARSECVNMMQIVAFGAVLPAAGQVQAEHGMTTRDMLALVSRSRFVPQSRWASFARGLALGFQGEFTLAAHLLIPQFENALRATLEAHGAVVSGLTPSGLQREHDLNRLFDMAETKALLGEDEHFEMESLLVHDAGANLRNRLAHGLLDDGAHQALLVYFWWKVLRYVVIFVGTENMSDVVDQDEGGG